MDSSYLQTIKSGRIIYQIEVPHLQVQYNPQAQTNMTLCMSFLFQTKVASKVRCAKTKVCDEI